MTCLDEAALLRVHFGDATTEERAHRDGCLTCAAAVRALATDVGRIDAVLRQTSPSFRASRSRTARWAPLAVAAVLALAVAVHRHESPVVATDDGDTAMLLDELSNDVLASDASDYDVTGTPAATTGRSTCTWGDPLLGVGCTQPSVTLIAWR